MEMEKRIRLHRLWERHSTLLIAVLLVCVFTAMSDEFLTFDNLDTILVLNTDLVVVVAGLAFIMIGGGIDLSVGYQISLISAVINVMIAARISAKWILPAALLTGLVCGMVNGVLVAYMNILPFAATIATQIIYRGLSYYLTQNRTLTDLPRSFRLVSKGYLFGVIRYDVCIAALCFLILFIVFRFTYLGKYIRAIGLDEEAAVRSGVKVKRVKCLSYLVAGGFYGLAAIIITARKGMAGSNIGVGMEIMGIAAAYIGGVSGQSAYPQMYNLLLGALIVAMIGNQFSLISINTNAQYIVTGVILVCSMLFHKTKR